jgi:hypothetical protein
VTCDGVAAAALQRDATPAMMNVVALVIGPTYITFSRCQRGAKKAQSALLSPLFLVPLALRADGANLVDAARFFVVTVSDDDSLQSR